MDKMFFAKKKPIGAAFLAFLLAFTLFFGGCLENAAPPVTPDGEITGLGSLSIVNGESVTLRVGETLQLTTDLPEAYQSKAVWTIWDDTGKPITLGADGTVTAVAEGEATVLVSCIAFTDTITVRVVSADAGGGTGGGTAGGGTGGAGDNTDDTTTGGTTGDTTGGITTEVIDFYGDSCRRQAMPRHLRARRAASFRAYPWYPTKPRPSPIFAPQPITEPSFATTPAIIPTPTPTW